MSADMRQQAEEFCADLSLDEMEILLDQLKAQIWMRKREKASATTHPHKLLDAVKSELGIRFDSELAKKLGLKQAHMSAIRCQRLRLTGDKILAIHDLTGFPIATIRKLIAEQEQP